MGERRFDYFPGRKFGEFDFPSVWLHFLHFFPSFFDLGNLTSSREGKEGKREAGDRRNKTFFVSLPPPLLSLSPSFERRGDEGGRGKLERILEGRKFADSEVNTHQIYVSHMAKEKYKWSIAKHIILFTHLRGFFESIPCFRHWLLL